jgi:hypothetical protein
MELKNETSRALSAWLAPGTWHTTHPLDTERFNKFVSAYEKEHGVQLDEAGLHEEIMRRYEEKEGREMSEGLQSTLRKKISLMFEILDFLRDSGRQSSDDEAEETDEF